jgi:adenine-specific DNA-methyltransferase
MTEEPTKVKHDTSDLAARYRAALAQLFPSVLADGVLDAAKLSELLDVQLVRAVDGRERYGLQWAGKQEAVRSLLTPSRGALVPDLDRSIDFDNAKNVFIEGDNLEVLKLLQKAYNDRVKLIYIDPPYNTRRDFVYEDDFSDTTRRYLVWSGQVDDEGKRKSGSNDAADGRLHSRWLSMMYPRLMLARNLLTHDGVILVSINDVEMPNLVHLLRDVFGSENHIATFVWNNDGNIEQQSAFKVNHEYIVAFARDIEQVARPNAIDPNIAEDSKLFNDTIENSITKNGPANPPSVILLPAGFPASTEDFEVAPRTDKWPHVLDPIVVQDGKLSAPARVFSGWSSKRLLELFISNGLVPIEDSEGKSTWFGLTPSGAIYGYKKRSAAQGHVLTVLRNLGTTKASSSRMLRDWGVVFDFPKPERLIQYLVSVFTRPEDLVLDFFAGSGSTAHGVALQNAADGGSRRYVLVNIPEPTRADSAAHKAGFETVSQITYHRIAAVAANVNGALQAGLRVYRLEESAFLDPEPENGEIMLSPSTLRADADDLYAIAGEILLKEGVPLDLDWVEHKFVQAFVQMSGNVAIVTGERLDVSTAEKVYELNPQPGVVVFLEDDLAGQDALKANLVANAKARGITVKTV